MLSVISLWVKQIVMVVMFAAFVDFLIPENKFFRYIKVFLGLLVMITIINPLIPLFQKDIALNEMSLVYKDLVDTEDIMHKSEILNMKNNELSIKQYKDHIERYLIQEITEITLYDVKNLTLEIDEDHFSENFGKITKLSIILSEKQTEKKKVKSKEEKIFVDAIKIRDTEECSNIISKNQNNVLERIIQHLNIKFEIQEENIFIDLEA